MAGRAVADLARVRALEAGMMTAWPAVETAFCAGWILRAANGYSRRANSASALFPEGPFDEATRDALLAAMRRMGVAPCFRISPLAGEEADAVLEKSGFARDVPTLTLAAPMPAELVPDLAGVSVRLADAAEPAWVAANAAGYGGEKANAAHLAAIVGRIRAPAAFATLTEGGEDVAWGIGVVVDGRLALQDLVVRPDRRGRGHGRRLVDTLLAFGAREGATEVFLQVREDNAIARRLYERLGFTTAYRYWHRVG